MGRVRSVIQYVLVMVVFAVICAGNAQASNYGEFLKVYDSLLNDYVIQTQKENIETQAVDYIQWGEDERHNLALKRLLAINPKMFLSQDRRKAFWINAYNFLTIDLIIKHGEMDSIQNLGGLFATPWTKHVWEIAGKPYTLQQIKDEILFPLDDPRIHFALSCAAITCPDLRSEVYTTEDLDSQLNDQVEITLQNQDKGMAIAEYTLYLHKIFEEFPTHFNNGDVLSWIEGYVNVDPHGEIVYFDHNWQLNSQLASN